MSYVLMRKADEYCVARQDTGTPVPGGWHGNNRDAAIRHLNALEASLGNEAKVSESLTPQETVIARYAFAGLCAKEIARDLVLAEGTVRVHMNNIHKKLNVNNRAGLIIKMLLLEMVHMKELAELSVMASVIHKRNN